MNILVCGGAGYIGSHVCKMLKEKNYNPIVYDNFSKGYRELAIFGDCVEGDIGDRNKLIETIKKYDIKAVMHFCAYIEVGESVIDPQKYYINNVSNTLVLIEAMRNCNVDYFIFSSTAATYGNPEKIPIEEDDPKIPINPYGRSKLFVENILDDYSNAYNFKSVRFRYFNASGASFDSDIGELHNPESHLIPLILQAASGERKSIKIFGTDYPTKDGTAIRDYIHVMDLAEAHILGLEYLINGGKTDSFNLGSGNGYSVREVIDMVKSVTGINFTVEETERRAGDPPILVADSKKAKKILNWETKYDLKTIVETAWKWHNSEKRKNILKI